VNTNLAHHGHQEATCSSPLAPTSVCSWNKSLGRDQPHEGGALPMSSWPLTLIEEEITGALAVKLLLLLQIQHLCLFESQAWAWECGQLPLRGEGDKGLMMPWGTPSIFWSPIWPSAHPVASSCSALAAFCLGRSSCWGLCLSFHQLPACLWLLCGLQYSQYPSMVLSREHMGPSCCHSAVSLSSRTLIVTCPQW
jgi:hypothetical protein